MSFAVLIGIGTAIGNVAGAAAATVLPAAIGGGAAGAGGLGAMAAATTAGTAGSALAGTALAPAASTAALGNLAAAAAPTAAPAAVSPLAGAVPASSGSGITSAGISAPGGMVSAAPTSSSGFLGPIGDFIGKQTIGSLLGEGFKSAVSPQVRAENQNAFFAQQDQEAQQQNADARELSAQVSGGISGGLGLGGRRFAHGGGVDLEEGQFIIPADVVSALGNGSTKAGAAFLDEFFGRA